MSVKAGCESIAAIETHGTSLVAVQRGDLDLKKTPTRLGHAGELKLFKRVGH
jgi:hypothetical protein